VIYLLTGQPGHGKTLRGLEMALDFKAQGRMVYAAGTPGLDYAKTGFLPLDDAKAWQDLPDNAVIFIDECYTVFPNRAANSSPPPHVEALARHRHRGFDFVLVCQLGNQIDPFLRGLVDQHTHVRRKFGFKVAVLKTWDHYEANPLKQDGSNRTWRHPKKVMDAQLYTSTTQDTTKRRLPWYFIAAPLVLGYVVYVFWKVGSGGLFKDDVPAVPAANAATLPHATAAPAAGASAAAFSNAKVITKEEYLANLTPRIETLPWSAPAFDGRKATSEPTVACMSTAAGLDANGEHREASCECMTEQGTRYGIDEKYCRQIARYGPPYNPFVRETSRDRQHAAALVRERGPERTAPFKGVPGEGAQADAGTVMSAPQISGYGDISVSSPPY
jgi:zona occludens toxin